MIGKFSNQIKIENHNNNSTGNTRAGIPVHIIDDAEYLVKPEDAGCLLLFKDTVSLNFENINQSSVFFLYGIATGNVEYPALRVKTTDDKEIIGYPERYYNEYGFQLLPPIMVHERKIYTFDPRVS
jgi:hypothetical protein